MEKNLKSLEKVFNKELRQLYECVSSNKLSLNLKKSNLVIFHPYPKKIISTSYQNVNNELNVYAAELNCTDYIKYFPKYLIYHGNIM